MGLSLSRIHDEVREGYVVQLSSLQSEGVRKSSRHGRSTAAIENAGGVGRDDPRSGKNGLGGGLVGTAWWGRLGGDSPHVSGFITNPKPEVKTGNMQAVPGVPLPGVPSGVPWSSRPNKSQEHAGCPRVIPPGSSPRVLRVLFRGSFPY